MASKVNVKFVAILAAAMVLLLGAVAATWLLVVRKSGEDYIRLGDEAMAQQDYPLADEYYAKAVNHDNSRIDWLHKWFEAATQLTPATETVYNSEYNKTYMGILQTIARNDGANIESHRALLDAMIARIPDGMVRSYAESIGETTEDALVWGEDDPRWQELRRYRGLAFERLARSGVTLTSDEEERTVADLRAALLANPVDADSALALSRQLSRRAGEARDLDRREEAVGYYTEALGVLDSFLEKRPGDPEVMLQRMYTAFDLELSERTWGRLASERERISRALLLEQAEAFREAGEASLEAPTETIDSSLPLRMLRFEAAILPDNEQALTKALAGRLLEARPDDGRLLLFAADLYEQTRDYERAEELLDHLASLPDLPLSTRGLQRFEYRRQALRKHAVLILRQAVDAPTDSPVRASAVERATALRGRLAEQVTPDSSVLTYIDALIAEASGEWSEAMRLYEQYNRDTGSRDADGLLRLGLVAQRMRQNGKARTALEGALQAEPGNMRAMLTLAQVYTTLQEYEAAVTLYESLAQALPDNEFVREQLAVVRTLADPAMAEDPVLAALVEAHRAASWSDDGPGDLARAEQLLAKAAEDYGWDPRIAEQLVRVRIDLDDFEGARAAAAAAEANNEPSERLARIKAMVSGDSVIEALLASVDASNASDVDKALARFRVYSRNGMGDEADAELARAAELAPDNPNVIEWSFLAALDDADYEKAGRLARRAAELNLDRAQGLTFQARIQIAQQEYDGAIATLERAIAGGAATPPVFRTLASVHRRAGNPSAAVATLERSLSARPDDPQAVTEYVAALVAAGRVEDALLAARRYERYGRDVDAFVSLWLDLEAQAGGEPGRQLAITRREQIRTVRPQDRRNLAALAGLYIDERRWADARTLIDTLRSEDDSLGLALLDARWNADQGRVIQPDGTAADGVELAQRVFTNYLVTLPEEEVTAQAYLAFAQFMLQRNNVDVALAAIVKARELQDEKVLPADKMLADVLLTHREYEQANEIYQKIVDAGADDAQQNYRQRLIETLLRLERFADAKRNLDALTDGRGESVTALLQRSQTEAGLGNDRRALELLDDAVARYPDSASVRFRRAMALLSVPGREEDVLLDLNEALKLDPSHWQSLRLRGSIHWSRGQVENGIRDLRSAVRANPDLTDVLFGLVNELVARERDGEAIDLVNEIVEKRRYDIPLIASAAGRFAALGQWGRAASLLEKAWQRSQDPAIGLQLIESLTRQQNPSPARAREVYERMLRLVPDAANNPQMLALNAMVLRAEGRPNSAERALREAYSKVRETPTEIPSWGGYSARVFAGGNREGEIAMLRAMSEAETPGSPQNRWLRLILAERLSSQESTRAEGLALYGRLRESGSDEDPVTRFAYRQAAATLYTNDRVDEAIALWTEGLERYPDDWELCNNMAYALTIAKDDPEAALPYAQKAVRLAEARSAVHDTLASVYLGMGRLDEAEASMLEAERLATSTQLRLNALVTRTKIELERGRIERARASFSELRTLAISSGLASAFERELTDLESRLSEASAG